MQGTELRNLSDHLKFFEINACMSGPPFGIFFPSSRFVIMLKCNTKRVWAALCLVFGFAFIDLLCLLGWVQLRLVLQEATDKAQNGER